MRSRVEQLLRGVDGSYEAFVFGMLHDCDEFGVMEDMMELLSSGQALTTSDVMALTRGFYQKHAIDVVDDDIDVIEEEDYWLYE